MKSISAIFAVFSLALLALWGCEETIPSRDHIPILKKRLFLLQEAVRAKDRAVIDSLLSVQILKQKQDSDSLLKFVYGSDGSFAFAQFTLGGITYTEDKARIDCYLTDTTGNRTGMVVLTFVREHDMWLLKRFEAGRDEDSLGVDTNNMVSD